MSTPTYDVIVIGSGPGGYVCAIRCAQLGLKVACVEKESTLGGTCLNVGCIPSKAMLESSERYEATQHSLAAYGVKVEGVSLDLATMHSRREDIVSQLTGGVDFLLKKNKIPRLNGFGSIEKSSTPGLHTVVVRAEDGTETRHETSTVVLATGSVVSKLRGVELDHERVVDSTGALEFKEVPKHLVLIGAGVIGLELGSVWKRLGAKVTVLEYLDRILPGVDGEIAKEAKRILEKQGLEFILGVGVESTERVGDEVKVTYRTKAGEAQSINGDYVLVAVGRRPFTEGLGLEALGVAIDNRGRVEIDNDFQTSVAGIFAIGDVVRGPMLAHKAEDEGVAVAEILAGGAGHVNYNAIPAIVYTHPEVAGVGKTEEELTEAGIPFVKGRFRFAANGRALALGETEGLVKMLAHKDTDRVLGCHIIGPRAGDLIAEVTVAMEFGASAEDIARSCHAHPTLAEVVREAALDCGKRALHK